MAYSDPEIQKAYQKAWNQARYIPHPRPPARIKPPALPEGWPKGLRHTAATREAIAEGQRRAWGLRTRKAKPRGKRAVLELTRLIAEQARDGRSYQIGSTRLEFWDVYRIEPDTYPPRETHRTRITSEPGWDERRQAA